jgi:DNA polymerase elongation subunit (family B)
MQLNLRPSTPDILGRPPLRFQILAVEVCKPPSSFDMSNTEGLVHDSMFAADEEPETWQERATNPCEVFVFGVSSVGHSITARVSGFMPYIFVEITDAITMDVIKRAVTEMRNKFNLGIADVCVGVVEKKKAYGWIPDEKDPTQVRAFTFAEIRFKNPWLLRVMARMFSERELACLRNLEPANVSEDKVAMSEKFLALHDLKPSGWAYVPPRTYSIVPTEKRTTMSQVEVHFETGRMQPLERQAIAPIVIAAVDIESHSHDYRSFPDAEHPGDKVTYIGTTFWVYGDSSPRERVMQVLGKCDEVEGITVQSFNTEYELLMGWRDLIAVHSDPDFMVSYNGTGFDYAYLAARVRHICKALRRRACRFDNMGRLLMIPNPLKVRELTSAAKGQNIISWFPQPGRIQMDLFMYVKDSQKLSSYKLDDVCDTFLKDTGKVVLDLPGWVRGLLDEAKQGLVRITNLQGGDPAMCAKDVDEAIRLCPDLGDYTECHAALNKAVHGVTQSLVGVEQTAANVYQRIMDESVQPALDASGDNNYRKLFRMYEVSASARAAIAVYCQVDCDLVVKLLDRLNVVANTFQMSQVCNTLADDVCNRGQQIKTFNLIARFARSRGYVMNKRDTGWDPEATYEGATVLEPTPGYYQTPVATLDFASLYPSLMRGFNLCPSSLVLDPEYTNLPTIKYGRYDIGGKTWVFQETTKGLLPDILGTLLAARKAKKREMKTYEKGSLDHRLCDGAQLALKVSCNSVYGFCGVVNNGMFPCLPVAVATTFNGRLAISQTKKFVEDTYGARVIYGDTDSVMLTFPGISTVPDAFEMGERVAAETTKIFPDTVVLEFEKIFYPYLLIKRKTYAGLKFEDSPDAPPSLDVKGLAVVRRDNCGLVREVMKDVLNLTMRENNPEEAFRVVQRAVDGLVDNSIPMDKLQITNSLKADDSYSNDAQPQLAVVRKMRKRRAFGIPRPGDRVPFVITEDPNMNRVSDRAEDPKFAEENGLKIDTIYYLTNQLERRLEGILGLLPVCDVGKMFADAVERVKARGLDTKAMMKLCKVTKMNPSSTISLPKPSVKKRKRATKNDVDSSLKSLMCFKK